MSFPKNRRPLARSERRDYGERPERSSRYSALDGDNTAFSGNSDYRSRPRSDRYNSTERYNDTDRYNRANRYNSSDDRYAERSPRSDGFAATERRNYNSDDYYSSSRSRSERRDYSERQDYGERYARFDRPSRFERPSRYERSERGSFDTAERDARYNHRERSSYDSSYPSLRRRGQDSFNRDDNRSYDYPSRDDNSVQNRSSYERPYDAPPSSDDSNSSSPRRLSRYASKVRNARRMQNEYASSRSVDYDDSTQASSFAVNDSASVADNTNNNSTDNNKSHSNRFERYAFSGLLGAKKNSSLSNDDNSSHVDNELNTKEASANFLPDNSQLSSSNNRNDDDNYDNVPYRSAYSRTDSPRSAYNSLNDEDDEDIASNAESQSRFYNSIYNQDNYSPYSRSIYDAPYDDDEDDNRGNVLDEQKRPSLEEIDDSAFNQAVYNKSSFADDDYFYEKEHATYRNDNIDEEDDSAGNHADGTEVDLNHEFTEEEDAIGNKADSYSSSYDATSSSSYNSAYQDDYDADYEDEDDDEEYDLDDDYADDNNAAYDESYAQDSKDAVDTDDDEDEYLRILNEEDRAYAEYAKGNDTSDQYNAQQDKASSSASYRSNVYNNSSKADFASTSASVSANTSYSSSAGSSSTRNGNSSVDIAQIYGSYESKDSNSDKGSTSANENTSIAAEHFADVSPYAQSSEYAPRRLSRNNDDGTNIYGPIRERSSRFARSSASSRRPIMSEAAKFQARAARKSKRDQQLGIPMPMNDMYAANGKGKSSKGGPTRALQAQTSAMIAGIHGNDTLTSHALNQLNGMQNSDYNGNRSRSYSYDEQYDDSSYRRSRGGYRRGQQATSREQDAEILRRFKALMNPNAPQETTEDIYGTSSSDEQTVSAAQINANASRYTNHTYSNKEGETSTAISDEPIVNHVPLTKSADGNTQSEIRVVRRRRSTQSEAIALAENSVNANNSANSSTKSNFGNTQSAATNESLTQAASAPLVQSISDISSEGSVVPPAREIFGAKDSLEDSTNLNHKSYKVVTLNLDGQTDTAYVDGVSGSMVSVNNQIDDISTDTTKKTSRKRSTKESTEFDYSAVDASCEAPMHENIDIQDSLATTEQAVEENGSSTSKAKSTTKTTKKASSKTTAVKSTKAKADINDNSCSSESSSDCSAESEGASTSSTTRKTTRSCRSKAKSSIDEDEGKAKTTRRRSSKASIESSVSDEASASSSEGTTASKKSSKSTTKSAKKTTKASDLEADTEANADTKDSETTVKKTIRRTRKTTSTKASAEE